MKALIPSLAVLALGLALIPASNASSQTTPSHARVLRAVDDPPPEPSDCPFCGGNGMVHVKRMIVLQKHVDCIAGLLTRW